MKNTVLMAIVVAMFTSLLTVVIYERWLRPANIVSFDVKKIIDEYSIELMKSSSSEELKTRKLIHFTQVMEQETAKYAADNQVVIMVSAAVVSGSQDITKDIQLAIINRFTVGS